MPQWTKEVVDLSVAGDALTIDNIKIDGSNIGHTDDTDLLTLASNALTVNGTSTLTGLVTASAGVKLGNNIIYASDGGTAITVDTSDNVTIGNDLKVAATNKIYLDGGTDTYFHVLSADNDIVQLASGVDNEGSVRKYNMAPKGGAGIKNSVYGQNAGSNIDANTKSCTYFGALAGDATHNDADANTGVGSISLSKLTTGGGNSFLGNSTGYEITTGNYNTGIGGFALQKETIGGKSVALGYNALGSQDRTGESSADAQNVAAGYYAGKNVTTGIRNVMIGWKSGYDADSPTYGTTTGSENVFIGGSTEASASTTDNEIVIGYNVRGKGANKTVIGNDDCTDVYLSSDSGASVHCTSITLKEGLTPTPLDSHGKIYTKSDNKLYFQAGNGTEYFVDVTAVGGTP